MLLLKDVTFRFQKKNFMWEKTDNESLEQKQVLEHKILWYYR